MEKPNKLNLFEHKQVKVKKKFTGGNVDKKLPGILLSLFVCKIVSPVSPRYLAAKLKKIHFLFVGVKSFALIFRKTFFFC